MLITRESDYAIRIMRSLATEEKLTVNEICENEQIPFSFAYKILKKLQKEGLVLVLRGANGGYKIKKSPSEITLLDVVKAIDEEVILNKCQSKNYVCEYETHSGKDCTVHKELCRLQKIMAAELSRYTLKEVIEG
ncbi:Rrf2 family transcriptional regulator [Lachnospiraceae bacterium TWA4]|nr:Rrf2 family transcriptional regulator [Lachnospiraceae bacterium TWA4]